MAERCLLDASLHLKPWTKSNRSTLAAGLPAQVKTWTSYNNYTLDEKQGKQVLNNSTPPSPQYLVQEMGPLLMPIDAGTHRNVDILTTQGYDMTTLNGK